MVDLVAKYAHARVPRYTSYPTAPHFHPGIDEAAYRGWLAEVAADATLSLYLHVPYCQQLCWYCGCNAQVANRGERVHAYADSLEREITLVAEALGAKRRVSHIHWGGGTPTMLSADDFRSSTAVLRACFAVTPDAEIAVEIDPRTLDHAKAAALGDAGVTRASLGVQDLTPEVQTAINRFQPLEQVAEAVSQLRASGIGAINFDLMYGLPHQTETASAHTVDQVVALEPDRVTVFGYAHVPWMKRHQRMIDEDALPDASARMAQADAAADRLVAHGYRRIGMDHFARPDDPMARALDEGRLYRNFQGYTTDGADALIGLGVSSISALPAGYAQNTDDLKRYREHIDTDRLPIARGVALSDDDRLRRAIIERLMCDHTVDLAALCAHFACPGSVIAGAHDALRELVDDGLVEVDAETIRVTAAGAPFIRSIAACFDAYLQPDTQRHAQAI